jgi:hypothetical protein
MSIHTSISVSANIHRLQRDLVIVKRDLATVKRDLITVKKDLITVKRDLITIHTRLSANTTESKALKEDVVCRF